MSDFSVTKFFRNQYLSEGDIRVNPYSLRNHPDVKILADTIGKMLNVEVEADLGGGYYNGREGYYIKMPRRDFQYWSDETKALAKAALDKASELSKEYDFEFHDVSDYEIEPGERDWPANIGFFIKEKESIEEIDMNDPVLMKMRASKMADEKEKARLAVLDKKYGSSYMDKLDAEINLKQELQDLKDERAQLMIDMEQEAEPEGGEIADLYGMKLNRIDLRTAEIKSELEDLRMYESISEEFKIGDKVTFKSGGGDMEIIDVRDMFASDLKAYRVKNADGETFEYSEDQLQLTEGESKMPTQDQVDKFFALTNNETHYLNSKPVMGQEGTFNLMKIEPWDEYDLSNWNSLVRKAKQQGKLDESASTEEKRIAMRAIKSIAKYRGVSEDEARNDLMRAAKELGSLKEAIKDIKETIELGKNLNEELCDKGKRYIKARQAAGEKSSAYLSGRAVKVCKGSIEWPKKGKK